MKIVSCAQYLPIKVMKKYFNYKLVFIIALVSLVLFSCKKDDTDEIVVRPYAEVYTEDMAEIENFLETHKVMYDANYNITFDKITSTNPGTPIKDYLDESELQNDDAKPLKFRFVAQHGLMYKIYYLKLREGTGNGNANIDDDQPTKLDSIYTTYRGHFVRDMDAANNVQNVFDEKVNPDWLDLESVIQGWREVFPSFKVGTSTYDDQTGAVTYNDFGAGVMFIPSGLGYYNSIISAIPQYSPLIFSFGLRAIRPRDHDGDKVLSKYEYGPNFPASYQDTDGDGTADYLDFDDDGDGRLTRDEIRMTTNPSTWYSFNDIPTCPGGTRKRFLDPGCRD